MELVHVSSLNFISHTHTTNNKSTTVVISLWQLSYINRTSELYLRTGYTFVYFQYFFNFCNFSRQKATSFHCSPSLQVVTFICLPPSLDQDTSDDITWSLHVKVQGLEETLGKGQSQRRKSAPGR